MLACGTEKAEAFFADVVSIYCNEVDMQYLGLVTISQTREYRIELSDGAALAIDGRFEGVHQIITCIQDAVYPRLLATVAATLASGASASFGAVTIDPHGISWEKPWAREALEWGNVRYFKIQNGRLIVRANSDKIRNWFSARTAEIPNLPVLWKLLEQRVECRIEGRMSR